MIPFHTILVPTDFSEHSELAFQMACSLARDTGARILALHVLVPPTVVYGEGVYAPLPEEYPKEWEEKLHALQSPTPNVTVEHLMVEGDPVNVILKTGRDSKCDLIVLGTHGRSGLKHFLMGSVAERVVREGPCPVLTVKAKPATQVAPKTKGLRTAARP